jgi:hypothetical protein
MSFAKGSGDIPSGGLLAARKCPQTASLTGTAVHISLTIVQSGHIVSALDIPQDLLSKTTKKRHLTPTPFSLKNPYNIPPKHVKNS